jgi:hypothetical protein
MFSCIYMYGQMTITYNGFGYLPTIVKIINGKGSSLDVLAALALRKVTSFPDSIQAQF